MSTSDSGIEPIELMADEFAERQRRGERPTIEEYVQRFPEMAAEIREVFPALAVIEQVAPDSRDLSITGVALDEHLQRGQLGDYRILREIGRGGMGVVYEAEQESLGRRVALKVLPRDFTLAAGRLERFEREARAAARMHHTNIVPVFDVGHEDGTAYYAMQLIRGQGLDLVIGDLRRLRGEQTASHGNLSAKRDDGAHDRSERLAASLLSGRFEPKDLHDELNGSLAPSDRAGGALTETLTQALEPTSPAVLPGQSDISTAESNRRAYFQSVAQIGIQTARALSYAHTRGIIHRDIKPSNLLLDSGGVIWVTDFGLAKTGDDGITHTGDVLGTLRYMSPERFVGQCDQRGDIYSLGLTLYELLVLKPAFASPDRVKTIELVCKTEPPKPRSIDPRIPRDLETIVLKSIDKDVKRRYQSADDLAEDLQRFVEDRPIRARRISSVERLARWTRRNKAIAALLVGGLLLVTGWIYREHRNSLHLRYRLAQQYLRQGQAICEDGRIDQGLHYFVRALDECPDSRPELVATIRSNFAGWSKRCNQLLQVFDHESHLASTGTGGTPLATAFSPDGRYLLTGGFHDHAVKVWSVETGEQVGQTMQHAAAIDSIFVTLDGGRIVTKASDGVVRLWNRSGVPLGEALSTEAVLIAFSVVNSRVAIVNRDGIVYVCSAQDGQQLGEPLHFGKVTTALSFTRDGERLMVGGDSAAAIWDIEAGGPPHNLPDLQGTVRAFHPDGLSMLVTDSETARIWSVATGEPYGDALPAERELWTPQYSPDGERISTFASGGMVRIWSSTTGNSVTPTFHVRGGVRTFAFSPDSQVLALGGWDLNASLWSTDTGRLIGIEIRKNAAIDSMGFRPGGDSLVFSAGGRAELWSADVGPRIEATYVERPGTGWGLDFSPDGDLIVTSGWEQLRLRSRSNGGAPREFSVPENAFTWDAKISPDGRTILAGLGTGVAKLWTIEGQEVATFGRQGAVRAVAFSPTGELIATGNFNGEASVWDPHREELVASFEHADYVEDVVFLRDGTSLVTACGDGMARIWPLKDNDAVPTILKHQDSVLGVAVSPDGELIATASRDQTVRFWSVQTGQAVGFVLQHSHWVEDVEFDPSGQLVATACADGRVGVWSLASGELIGPPLEHAGTPVRAVTFDPACRCLLTALGHRVFLWTLQQQDLDVKDLHARVEAITGTRMDDRNTIVQLAAEEWRTAKVHDARVNGAAR